MIFILIFKSPLGFVTTTRVTHATPAALYAHSANRDWECLIPGGIENNENVKDIAWQLINTSPGNKAKVILGGGYPAFEPRPDDMPRKSPKEVIEMIYIMLVAFKLIPKCVLCG